VQAYICVRPSAIPDVNTHRGKSTYCSFEFLFTILSKFLSRSTPKTDLRYRRSDPGAPNWQEFDPVKISQEINFLKEKFESARHADCNCSQSGTTPEPQVIRASAALASKSPAFASHFNGKRTSTESIAFYSESLLKDSV
jgi:hypothetical protein